MFSGWEIEKGRDVWQGDAACLSASVGKAATGSLPWGLDYLFSIGP